MRVTPFEAGVSCKDGALHESHRFNVRLLAGIQQLERVVQPGSPSKTWRSSGIRTTPAGRLHSIRDGE